MKTLHYHPECGTGWNLGKAGAAGAQGEGSLG